MRSRRRFLRGLSLVLAVVLLGGFLLPPAVVAGPQEEIREVATEVEAKAGGWGLLTPVIAITARGVRAAAAPESSRMDELQDVPSLLRDGKFLGGLAGGMALAAILGHLAPMLPGGIFLRTAVAMSGGFIGCELGSGTIGETDWLNLWTQVAVASLVQIGGAALGLGGLPLLLITAGTAIASGILLDRIRGKTAEGDGATEATADGADGDVPSAPSSTVDLATVLAGRGSSSTAAEMKESRDEAYRSVVSALEGGGDPGDLRATLAAYGAAQETMAAGRRLAYARP